MLLYDIVIIGSGSIGTSTAYFLSKDFKVLVIDKHASAGQGQNKKAIGGIRASHSNTAKLILAKESMDIFKNWQKLTGDDILFNKNGYIYLAYNQEVDNHLKKLTRHLKNNNINVKYLKKNEIKDVVKHINTQNLISAMYCPDDASASPLLFINSLYFNSLKNNVKFLFNEKVIKIKLINDTFHIQTDKNSIIQSKYLINAAGANANEITNLLGKQVKVVPDSHEAGITEPIGNLSIPMIVDLTKEKNSSNIYFYQNTLGQILFSLTPKEPIVGEDTRPTSSFLPEITRRILKILPILKNVRIRRTWRGLYPSTPDSNPIISVDKDINNLIYAIGMCGQGFMLAPGVAKLIHRLLTKKLNKQDKFVLEKLSLYRNFSEEEKLK